MKLYFYCSSGSLLEYFTINRIVCNEYLSYKNGKVIPSLGLPSDKFIFLSPHKLSLENRTNGFDKDYMEIGTVLEVEVCEEDAKHFPVIILNKDGILSDDFTNLSNVTEDIMGVFIKGELSFTYISHILFENDNSKDDIYRPSKDLYFPEHLYSLVDVTFDEKIDTDCIRASGKALDEKFKDDDISRAILKRNKISSIILNIILETKEWPFGDKYKANFDDITAHILGISDKLDEYTDKEYSRLKDKRFIDEILKKIDNDEDVSSLAPFFKAFINELISISTNSFSQNEYKQVIDKVINVISSKYSEEQIKDITKKVDMIDGLVYGTNNYGLEKLLSELPQPYDVLKAMIFFLRSPLSSMKLMEGLSVYKVEPQVCRYAWIMFSALNGLEPISSDKTGNDYVMRIAESKSMKMVPIENGINDISSVFNKNCLFIPMIEEDISAELVRKTILSEEFKIYVSDMIKSFATNPVLKKGFKENNYKLIKNPFTNCPITNEIITQSDAENYISKLKDMVKNSKFEYDINRFVEDYIKNEKVFSGLYKKDEAFWKNIYKNRNK